MRTRTPSSENRLELDCRRPLRLGASTLRRRANLGPKDAPCGWRDLRTRRAATSAKVILLPMSSKTFFGSYSYSQNPQANLEFFMHTQIHHEAAARQQACDQRAQTRDSRARCAATSMGRIVRLHLKHVLLARFRYGFVLINALVFNDGSTLGLSATRKLSPNGDMGMSGGGPGSIRTQSATSPRRHASRPSSDDIRRSGNLTHDPRSRVGFGPKFCGADGKSTLDSRNQRIVFASYGNCAPALGSPNPLLTTLYITSDH